MRKDDTRRANLRAVIAKEYQGIDGYLADAIGMPRSNLSRILNGERPFTEKKARDIERKLNLPPESLDFQPPVAGTVTAEDRQFLADLSRLVQSRDITAQVRAAILAIIESCPKKR